MAGVFTSGIQSPGERHNKKKIEPLPEVFHKDSGEREVNSDARNVVGSCDERSCRNGGIDTNSLQDNRHERRHAGRHEKCRNERDTDNYAKEALMPDPSDQRQDDPASYPHQQTDLDLSKEDIPDVGYLD